MSIKSAVRLVLGHKVSVENPPREIASAATDALRNLARASFEKKLAHEAERLAVFPIPERKEICVGYGRERSPVHFDARQKIDPNSAIAAVHPIVPTGLSHLSGPYLDMEGLVHIATQIGRWIERLSESSEWKEMQVQVEPSSLSKEAEISLMTDDGRPGALVWGVVYWKRGPSNQKGRVQTWVRDLGDGEFARLIGVPMAEVNADTPAVVIDSEWLKYSLPDDCKVAQEEILKVKPAATAFGWWLVS